MENQNQPTSEGTKPTHNMTAEEKQEKALLKALSICRADGYHELDADEVDELAYQIGRFLRRTLGCYAPVITPEDIRNSMHDDAETLTHEEAAGICEALDDCEGVSGVMSETIRELIGQAIEARDEGDAE